jgi:hypothetical protein
MTTHEVGIYYWIVEYILLVTTNSYRSLINLQNIHVTIVAEIYHLRTSSCFMADKANQGIFQSSLELSSAQCTIGLYIGSSSGVMNLLCTLALCKRHIIHLLPTWYATFSESTSTAYNVVVSLVCRDGRYDQAFLPTVTIHLPRAIISSFLSLN